MVSWKSATRRIVVSSNGRQPGNCQEVGMERTALKRQEHRKEVPWQARFKQLGSRHFRMPIKQKAADDGRRAQVQGSENGTLAALASSGDQKLAHEAAEVVEIFTIATVLALQIGRATYTSFTTRRPCL
ncbi:hypothetical protein L227DRAFT_291802 [Lentinus tigrinus ALCF2SS1-6]|uniref:Uncharacterized protein n=1 Tax=Lentinus tigrinus ALCF2SS1-6 TaxID=1328759 RepID=A0A5C2RY88_9APHY|nr:hypothetical protein L227DRAFT_291802 [Lentinus tigrinus ALCF2SS1-6]